MNLVGRGSTSVGMGFRELFIILTGVIVARIGEHLLLFRRFNVAKIACNSQIFTTGVQNNLNALTLGYTDVHLCVVRDILDIY